jgi:hypothetical protein
LNSHAMTVSCTVITLDLGESREVLAVVVSGRGEWPIEQFAQDRAAP